MTQHMFSDFQKMVDITQSNEDNTVLIESLLPALQEFVNISKTAYNEAVQAQGLLTNVEIVQLESLADMLHVCVYNFVHNPPVNSPKTYAKLVELYSSYENITRTFAQYGRGMLNSESGCFFASEQNLQELVNASAKMIDNHVIGQSVSFVQVA